MTTLKKINIVLLGILSMILCSCSNELTMFLPEGPKGADGLSAYDVWVQSVKDGTVEWDKDRTDITNFFLFLKGKDGTNGVDGKSAYQLWVDQVASGITNPHNEAQQWDKDKTSQQDFWYFLTGADGQDGSTPTIGSNGNWFIDGKDTGLTSKGKDGIDGANGTNGLNGSVVTIGDNGNWYIDGKDTGKSSKGKDGTNGVDGKASIVTIGSNGNWFIDGKDTGKTSKGTNGTNGIDGKSSVVTIGSNDNWYIDGKDTGLTSKGKDGADGSVVTIGSNGNWIIDGQDTNKPSKGQDGAAGAPGKDGTPGSMVTIGTNNNWYIDGVDTKVPAFGQDGKDGDPGKDGANGQSAYDLWVTEVGKGIDDPHNPGQQWDKSKTTTQDFWAFLRGADGKDGTNAEAGGETGQPGAEIKVVAGQANVIPQYVNQSYNEFVRWEDGGVTYIVYDDVGKVASGAKVKGLPGISDSTKVYTANTKGEFIVPKEDLPIDKAVTLRRGATASVEYVKSTGGTVTEKSAPNTYVPNKIFVQIRLRTAPVIDGVYMRLYPVVERKTDGGSWQVIPTYLGDINQQVKAYELSNLNDPTSHTTSSFVYTEANTKINISGSSESVRINRLRKNSTYYPTPVNLWDGKDHYFTLVLESYYGESPETSAVVKMAPIQAMPMIKSASAQGYRTSTGVFGKIDGELDIAGAKIDANLMFKNAMDKVSKTNSGVAYDSYSPVKEDVAVFNNAKVKVTFSQSDFNSSVYGEPTIANPTFTINTPYIEASIVLTNTNSYFYSLNTVGYLKFGTIGDMNTLTIVKRNDPDYVFTNIPIPFSGGIIP